MKVAALCILALSFIIGCSEAFIARRLVVPPALFTNKVLATTAPQHARVTALRDDPKGIFDVVFNSIPLAVLYIAATTERENRKEVFAAQNTSLAAWKAVQQETIAAEKERQDKAIAAEKESREKAFVLQEKAIAAEKESRKEDFLLHERALAAEKERQDKALAAEKERQDKALAAERENREKAIAAERDDREKAIATERESRKEDSLLHEKAIATETARQDKALAAEKESREKAIAAEREDLKAALLHQNEIWSLRFETYAAKGKNFKKDDGTPPLKSPRFVTRDPPSPPSDSKSK